MPNQESVKPVVNEKLMDLLRRIYFCGGDKLREEKDLMQAHDQIIELFRECLGDRLPINPNSSHCSQCGRDFYSFNNGYNLAITEAEKKIGGERERTNC